MKHPDSPLTSEALGGTLWTNAVVVRRLFSGLRDTGYGTAEHAKPRENITLLEV